MKRLTKPGSDGQRGAVSQPSARLLLMILSVGLCMPAFAQEPIQEPVVSVGVKRGFPGRSVIVPVGVSNVTNAVAAQFDFIFDPEHVSLAGLQPAAATSNHIFRSHQLAPGIRRVLVYSITNASLETSGDLAALDMAVPPNERIGSGPMNVSNVVFARFDGSPVEPVEAIAGAVFVSPVYRNPVNGQVQVFFASEPGRRYVLQATTDLVTWVNLSTNLATAEFIDLLDADSPNYAYRFYRLLNPDAIVAPSLSGLRYLPGGSVSFQATGWEGQSYQILASTNLMDWIGIGTATVTNGQMLFVDPSAVMFPKRFYRLKSQ